jgi:hypothetical protein
VSQRGIATLIPKGPRESKAAKTGKDTAARQRQRQRRKAAPGRRGRSLRQLQRPAARNAAQAHVLASSMQALWICLAQPARRHTRCACTQKRAWEPRKAKVITDQGALVCWG